MTQETSRSSTSLITATAQFVVLLLTLFASLAALYAIHTAQDSKKALYQMNGIINKALQGKQQAAISLATLNEAYASIQSQLIQLEQKITEHQPSTTQYSLIVQQAKSYLEMANLESQWGGNPSTCLMLLTTTETLLKTITEPSLQPVLVDLQQSIQQLQALPKLDRNAQLEKIYRAEERLVQLKAGATPSGATEIQSHPLQSIVTIKYHPSTPNSEQNTFQTELLMSRLQLNFLEMKLAVLQNNASLYDIALQRTKRELSGLSNDSAKTPLAAELQSIEQPPAFVTIPSLEKPLKALNTWVEQHPTIASPHSTQSSQS